MADKRKKTAKLKEIKIFELQKSESKKTHHYILESLITPIHKNSEVAKF